MKHFRSFLALSLVALSLAGGSVCRTYAVDCLAQPFLQITDAHKEIVEVLTRHVKDMSQTIQNSQRWQTIENAADKFITADAEMQRSLALANKLANPVTGSLGSLTFDAHVKVLKQERLLASARTSLDEVGKGVGALARHPDLVGNDDLLARCIREPSVPTFNDPTNPKLSTWHPSRSHFVANNYTDAEYFSDWNTLLGDANSASHAQIGPNMWTAKLPNADTGAIAEVAVAARLKRRGHTGITVGPDEITGNPLKDAKVDIETGTEMYQVGLKASTIKNKLQNELSQTAQGIKKALDAKPGKPYYFGHTLDDWSPTQGDLNNLNSALVALYAAEVPPRLPPTQAVFTTEHFKFFSLEVNQ